MRIVQLVKSLLPSGRRAWLAFAGIAVVATVSLATAFTAPASRTADPELARQAQCEYGAGLVGETLVNNGVDIRTQAWSRDRERAIQACKGDFPDWRWLMSGVQPSRRSMFESGHIPRGAVNLANHRVEMD